MHFLALPSLLSLILYFTFPLSNLASASDLDRRIHLPLYRRGGRLTRHSPANFTHLTLLLHTSEARYSRTRRVVEGNKLSRTWKAKQSVLDEHEDLVGDIGRDGGWYVELQIGTPPQRIEVDIDMLSADFYILQTTSEEGTKFNTFSSSSHIPNDARVHPICRSPSDIFHFNTHSPLAFDPISTSLAFALCTPSKSSSLTLLPSGGILGLAPALSPSSNSPLRRLTSKSLLQLPHLPSQLYSLTLFDAETGLLTLSGTIAREIEEARLRGEVELEFLGRPELTSTNPNTLSTLISDEVAQRMLPFPPSPDTQFQWVPTTHRFPGWSSPLLSGIWLHGSKILRNQPTLLDISCPFILAPPLAAARFYAAIPSSFRLPGTNSHFWAVPCLNPPPIAFEFAGWLFPVFGRETRADALRGPPGGPGSLGRLGNGTGFCVGVVVASERSESDIDDAWVLGEPFFRGMGVAFDGEKGLVGFRTY